MEITKVKEEIKILSFMFKMLEYERDNEKNLGVNQIITVLYDLYNANTQLVERHIELYENLGLYNKDLTIYGYLKTEKFDSERNNYYDSKGSNYFKTKLDLYSNKINEYEKLCNTKKRSKEQSESLADLDIELNRIIHLLADNEVEKFRNAQILIYK
jgi:hypothetical protein